MVDVSYLKVFIVDICLYSNVIGSQVLTALHLNR